MQTQDISVSTGKGAAKVSVTVKAPKFETLDDFRGKVASFPKDSKVTFTAEQNAVLKDVIVPAAQAVIIKMQGRARAKLDGAAPDKGKAAVQTVVDNYVYGARGEATPKVKHVAVSKAVKFTPAQIAALKEQGVEVALSD
jgi:hypothetical protein